jgi:hypothetical protein
MRSAFLWFCRPICAGSCSEQVQLIVWPSSTRWSGGAAAAGDAGDASFCLADRDAEVPALALDCVRCAVEFTETNDAVPEADVAVVRARAGGTLGVTAEGWSCLLSS